MTIISIFITILTLKYTLCQVLNVGGTANQINSSGGQNPILSITHPFYLGGATIPRPTWISSEARGLMTYFDIYASCELIPPTGLLGYVAGVRTSDINIPGDQVSISFASYAAVNNTYASSNGGLRSTWTYYGSSTKYPRTHGGALGIELDIANQDTYLPQDSYLLGQPNITAVAWLASGGEWAQAGVPLNPTSLALGILDNGAVHGKGIVIGCNALLGTTCVFPGRSTALQMALGHEVEWEHSSLGIAARIGSSITSNTYGTQLYFRNGATYFEDITTTSILFAALNPSGKQANYPFTSPDVTGHGVILGAAGRDIDIDIKLVTKGSGVLQLGYASISAKSPTCFRATHYLSIKDSSGTVYYIPLSTSRW